MIRNVMREVAPILVAMEIDKAAVLNKI